MPSQSSSGNGQSPANVPAQPIAQFEIDDLKDCWKNNPHDLGVGLYNPLTGEIHVGSFDQVTQGAGHQGMANALGITNTAEWRGFVVDSQGGVSNFSHFNAPDKNESGQAMRMKASSFQEVERELRRAGLAN